MSDCSCVYVGDSESSEFESITNPVSRKTHKCYECGKEILPGEKYERSSGVWDGDFNTFKTCADCLSTRESFFCGGYIYGALWEYLWEHLRDVNGEVSSDCIVPLTPEAREKVCDMIERVWGK